MNSFLFFGETSCSKSLMNRALIAQSYFPHLKIEKASKDEALSKDILQLRNSLAAIQKFENTFDCGEGGTTFRFLAIRVSRVPGKHLLKMHPRLRERPHSDLISLLDQLGVKSEFQGNALLIQSEGWRRPKKPLEISRKFSSQFASGLLLNAWNLDFEIPIFLSEESVSDDYFEMTMRFCREMGMKVLEVGDQLTLLPHQKVLSATYDVEMDISSLFSLATAAALDGELKTEEFPIRSLQPDSRFVEIFAKMNIPQYYSGHILEIKKAEKILPIKVNLNNCPDLFPVLSVLCAFADGVSELSGASQLIYKESDRIAKTAELLKSVGIWTEAIEGGLRIFGGKPSLLSATRFNPDHDHRMAMAAGLLRLKGFPLIIENPEVVEKSFPLFWKTLGVSPC
ncbi:MAG: 3-phosphoshikimate 1-carboxyvinyltransferase [Pseudobdellovibrionaceae bacterium]